MLEFQPLIQEQIKHAVNIDPCKACDEDDDELP